MKFKLIPGATARWWHHIGGRESEVRDVLVVRVINERFTVVRLPDGTERRVMTENLMRPHLTGAANFT